MAIKGENVGTHYKVYIFDDHLGWINKRTASEEAEFVNLQLNERKASLFEPFEYVQKADCLVGELRKDHPSNHMEVFGKYDGVYFNQDDSGKTLRDLKEYVQEYERFKARQ